MKRSKYEDFRTYDIDIRNSWKPFVYDIECNNEHYIGSTIQGGTKRWNKHISLLVNHKHPNYRLQSAFDKSKYIKCSVIKYCSIDTVCQEEQYYIDVKKPSLNIAKKVSCYTNGYCKTKRRETNI